MADDDSKQKVDSEAALLLDRIAVHREAIESREAAVEILEDRLRLLMNKTGGRSFKTAYATARVGNGRRSFQVIDATKFKKLFPYDLVVEHFKPPAKFYDAAKEQEIDVDKVIRVGVSENFSVSLSRTKDALERRSKMAEGSRIQAREEIEEIKKQLRGAKQNGKRSNKKSG